MASSEFFWRAVSLHCRKILGASGDAPSRIFRRINSALRKIRHLAKASGMDRKILKGSHPALRTFMHTCTHARLHAYTPARGIVVDDEKLERRL